MRDRFLAVVDDLDVQAQGVWGRLVAQIKENPDVSTSAFEKEIDDICAGKDASGQDVLDEGKLNRVVNFLSPHILQYSLSDEPPAKVAAVFLYSLWTNHYFDTFSAEDRLTLSKKLVELNEGCKDPQTYANNLYGALQLGGRSYGKQEYEALLAKSLDATMGIAEEAYRDALGKWIVDEAKQVLGEKSTMALIMRRYEVQHEKWTKGLNSLVGYLNPYRSDSQSSDWTYTPHPGLKTLQPQQP